MAILVGVGGGADIGDGILVTDVLGVMAVLGILGVVLAIGHDAGGGADIMLSGTPQYTPPAVRSWVSEDALDRVHKVAPGWDRQWLLSRYQEWTMGKPTPANIDAAFLGWAKKFTKGKGPS